MIEAFLLSIRSRQCSHDRVQFDSAEEAMHVLTCNLAECAASLPLEAQPSGQEECVCAPAPLQSKSWEQPVWGLGRGSGAALEARVCPWYEKLPVKSLCHIADRFDDHHCLTSEDCGIDAGRPVAVRLSGA